MKTYLNKYVLYYGEIERRCLRIAIDVDEERSRTISDRLQKRRQKDEEKYPEDYFEVKICRAKKKYGFVGEWNEIAVDEKIAEIID